MKYFKTFVIGILICLFIIGSSITVFAHPPKDIAIEFNKETKTLKITVTHPVNPQTIKEHFIKDIKVYLNDEMVIQQTFKSQSSANTQDVSYTLIDAEKGNKIKVEAQCCIMGSLDKTISIQ
jgi:desulfoferrodoxin (superoxide reductase-like protein)